MKGCAEAHSPESPYAPICQRHCERREAIQLSFVAFQESWIASSQALPCANASRLSQAMTLTALVFETDTLVTVRLCYSDRPGSSDFHNFPHAVLLAVLNASKELLSQWDVK
jgi:hypothetical protein